MDFESDFVEQEIGLDTDCDDEHTVAHQAAASGDTQLLIRAIKQDPSVIQQKDREGYVPLAHAVIGKHIQTLKRLVKMGADINVQDAQGRTCLAVAAYQGWSEGVVYLLRKGARQDLVDKSGRTPLHAATYDTETKCLTALMKHLSLDVINMCDNERMTALHWAAFHNRPEHVRQLLQKGADPYQADIDGKTPLHWAAQNGSVTCSIILAEQCDDLPSKLDNCGKTALHLAAAAGHVTILQDLARVAPATCEAWDKDDRTPLHWAAATGSTGCVRALLNLGVVPNPVDADAATPLEYAINAGHKECAAILRERLGIKTNQNKRSIGRTKPSPVGFFKVLFSKKKEPDKTTPENELGSYNLPRVVSLTKNGDEQNNKSKDKQYNELLITKHSLNNVHISANARDKDGSSAREQGITVPKQGGSKKSKPVDRDAGIRTPATSASASYLEDNSSMISGSRGAYLSPIAGARPPSISPRIGLDAGGLSPVPVRRQRELDPIPTKGSSEVPALERVKHEGTSGPRSPTPPPPISFNPKRRSVLPDIQRTTPTFPRTTPILPENSHRAPADGSAPISKLSPLLHDGTLAVQSETVENTKRKKKKTKKNRRPKEDKFIAKEVGVTTPDGFYNEYQLEPGESGSMFDENRLVVGESTTVDFNQKRVFTNKLSPGYIELQRSESFSEDL